MNALASPQQKIEVIREQIAEVRAGLRSFIACPYCGGENDPSNRLLCCKMFAEASSAVLDRMEKQEAIDFLEQVQVNGVN